MSRNWSEKTEPKKQNVYASFDWRKKQPTGRKIHPAMAVTKRSMPSRNDVLINGPEPILDGAYKAAKRREAIRATFGTKQTSLPTLSMTALRGKADIPDPMSD